MSEVIINNVKFKNVPDKRYGTKIGDLLTQSNVGMSQTVADYIQSDDFYALVNGVDIDWNSIEVEDGLVLNTTADFINWIVSIINKIPLVKIISVVFSTEKSFPTSEEIQQLLDMSVQDFARYGSKYQYYFYLKKEQKYYFIPAAYNKDNTNVISIRGIDDIAVLSFNESYANGALSFSEKQAPDLSNYYTKEEVNTLLDGKIDLTLKGAKNGVASLDSTGKVPASQLPSYVDDVLEGYLDDSHLVESFSELNSYNAGEIVLYLGTIYRFKVNHAPGIFTPDEMQKIDQFPAEGETGKIYSDIITGKTYRWSGSTYVPIKGDVVIGTTQGTAFDGAAGAALQTQVSGISTQVAGKVDKETGKGLSSNDYTNEEKQKVADALVPADIAEKANASDVYTKEETYSKTEVNNLITTPNQQYVSVTATTQTTAVTDVLPATGAADTTYRVGCWDGTQYNDSVFSEYAWNGSAYIKLSTKAQVGEVYDISANHADTKYSDLAAALGTDGANIPSNLRKGGMSVKFVQSSDNKYVQCRLMADSFTTDISEWEKSDFGELKHETLNAFIIKDYFYSGISGAWTNSPTDYSTPKTPIVGNIYYKCFLGGSTYPLYGITFFDENEQFINQTFRGENSGLQEGILDITDNTQVPSGARYFACTVFQSHLNKKPYAFCSPSSVLSDRLKRESDVIKLIPDLNESKLIYESSTDNTDVYITDFAFSTRGTKSLDILGVSGLASATGASQTTAPSGKASVKLENTKLLVLNSDNWALKIKARGEIGINDVLLVACRNGQICDGLLYERNSKSIMIVPVSSTSFDVFVPQLNNNGFLRHRFIKQQYSRTLNYDGGTKSVECANIWYPSEIFYKNESVIQGNLNFIFRIDDTVSGFENENDHVGAGHGGEVMEFQNFYADGIEFNPSTLTAIKYCNVMRIVTKANVYAIDTTQPDYVQGSDTLKLDSNGDKILTAIHTYDAEYRVDNIIKWNNNLVIKRDNVVFNEAHGAMCQGLYPAFNRVTVEDDNFDTNFYTITYGQTPVISPVGNSKNLFTDHYSKADSVILYGNGTKGIIVKQSMQQDGKDNYVDSWFYYNSGATRLKCYMMPVKGKYQFPTNPDTFNNGDTIKVKCERQIVINE